MTRRLGLDACDQLLTHENLHLFVQPIVHDQGVTHPYSGRFHSLNCDSVSIRDLGF